MDADFGVWLLALFALLYWLDIGGGDGDGGPPAPIGRVLLR